jgi:hypothetical protein
MNYRNNLNFVFNKFIIFNLRKSIIGAVCGFTIVGLFFATLPNITASALQSINKYVNGYTDVKNYDKVPSKADLQNIWDML